jgi:hypothetical protein
MYREKTRVPSNLAPAEVPAACWAGSGRPYEKNTRSRKGRDQNLFYLRYWAHKKGVKATPPPASGIMEGGTATNEELARDKPKGIGVRRMCYIRTVDPQTLLCRGLAHDPFKLFRRKKRV